VTRRSSATLNAQMVTSTLAIEKAAIEVFQARGFEETRVEDIAAAAGISRRTFFRYFASKNDILFPDFDDMLGELEEWLLALPDDRPMFELIADATMRFNRIHSEGADAHRERMALILHTPALRASASLQNAKWAGAVARYAARRMGAAPEELGPQLVGQVALGAANAAYEEWLRDETSDLDEVVHRTFALVPTLLVR
jgi:mycofactocin system transcriptional regulator